jgi:DNA-binding MurR/RpiR family transcriptional regulator
VAKNWGHFSLFVVISLSGETVETLEVITLASAEGMTTLAFCYVDSNSSWK